MFKDKVITCIDCKQQFCWTAEEQEYYQDHKLQSPTRCPICQAAYQEAQKDKFRGKISH